MIILIKNAKTITATKLLVCNLNKAYHITTTCRKLQNPKFIHTQKLPNHPPFIPEKRHLHANNNNPTALYNTCSTSNKIIDNEIKQDDEVSIVGTSDETAANEDISKNRDANDIVFENTPGPMDNDRDGKEGDDLSDDDKKDVDNVGEGEHKQNMAHSEEDAALLANRNKPQQYSGVFPQALDESPSNKASSTSFSILSWKQVFINASTEYKDTFKVDDDTKAKQEQDEDVAFLSSKTEELMEQQSKLSKKIRRNARKNYKVLSAEGEKLLSKAQDETGIYTTEDVKSILAGMLKLATECTSEFMKGYRTGRDKEIDRVMNEYFGELDGKKETKSENGGDVLLNKKKRRIRKRDLTFLL